MQKTDIQIVNFTPELATHFEHINRLWIESMFVLEQVDIDVLQHPQQRIIEPGGRIWFAQHPTLGIVGTCALLNKGNGEFELTKMGVLSEAQGLKVGEQLLQYVIKQAQLMQVKTLFLLTNAKCEAAIHLYLKNGFHHDASIMKQYGGGYSRCNVAMRYVQK